MPYQNDGFWYGFDTAQREALFGVKTMNISQIIDALPLQVYVRRGELVIHFSTPADLISRLAETSVLLSDLDRQAEAPQPDGKLDRAGRRTNARLTGGARSDAEAEGSPANDPEQPGRSG